MCEPVTIGGVTYLTATQTALVSLTVASAAASTYAQQQSADAQAKAASQQAQNKAEESAAAAAEKLGARVREGRRARGRAIVAAGEANVGGNSFSAVLQNSLMQQDMDAALIQQNAAFQGRAIQGELKSAIASTNAPTALSAGLNIAGAGVSGYASGLQIENAKKT